MYQCKALFLSLIFAIAFSADLTARSMPPGTTNSQDLISVTCKRTFHDELCVSSLRSDPRSATVDLQGLARIAVDLSINEGARIISHVSMLEKHAESTHGDPWMVGCLRDCLTEYSDAVEDLRQSAVALEKKSYGDFNDMVSSAMTDSSTCEDGFQERPGFKSPLTGRNDYFSNLCSNALAIARLLQ